MLLDGTGPYQMFDNLTVNGLGHVILPKTLAGSRTWRASRVTSQ